MGRTGTREHTGRLVPERKKPGGRCPRLPRNWCEQADLHLAPARTQPFPSIPRYKAGCLSELPSESSLLASLEETQPPGRPQSYNRGGPGSWLPCGLAARPLGALQAASSIET